MRPIGLEFLVVATGLFANACSCVSRAEASVVTHGERHAVHVSAGFAAGTRGGGLVRSERGFSAEDSDGDGIDDARELSIAKDYFPYYSMSTRDGCSRHGVLFRLTPHPEDRTKLMIWYAVLFERDCGTAGIGAHVGDDEVFGEVVDPARPPPSGILALRGISHQNTTCERVTTCGSLPGCDACAVANRGGKPYPVVFSSANKHGNYVSERACNLWPCDFAACTLNAAPDAPPFTNAGEPGMPMTNDLSDNGFVNSDHGWTEGELMHFDPWGRAKFGGAGEVTSDLTDEAFLVSPGGC